MQERVLEVLKMEHGVSADTDETVFHGLRVRRDKPRLYKNRVHLFHPYDEVPCPVLRPTSKTRCVLFTALSLLCLLPLASKSQAVQKPPQKSSPYVINPPKSIVNDRRRLAPLQVAQVVRAPAWIVMDADSGRVLKEYSSRRRMFPASTTKTLTALTALRHAELTNVIRVGPNPPKVGEQSAYLLEGEKFTLADLLRAAMVKSANDACVAIAEGVGGDVPNFAKLMNAEARRVGALNSNFVNPNGLHDANHYTTAYDLARIARAATTSPFFNQIVRLREAEIHGNWKIGGNRVLVSKNRLLWLWDEADGIKTGYTRQAGRCLIASATRRVRDSDGKWRNWRLISVVLHSSDVSGESARLLLDGFAHFRLKPVAQKGQSFGNVEVRGGASFVQAVTPDSLHIPLRPQEALFDEVGLSTSPEQVLEIGRNVRLRQVNAPVRQGQVVGIVEWTLRGKVVAKLPLVSQANVPVAAFATQIVPAPLLRHKNELILLSNAFVLAVIFVLLRRTRAR